jgi:hypothetical protein
MGVGAMLQDIELMPQSQDFGFYPLPHSKRTKRLAIAIIR